MATTAISMILDEMLDGRVKPRIARMGTNAWLVEMILMKKIKKRAMHLKFVSFVKFDYILFRPCPLRSHCG